MNNCLSSFVWCSTPRCRA